MDSSASSSAVHVPWPKLYGHVPYSNPQHLYRAFQVPKRGPCSVSVTVQSDYDPDLHGIGLIETPLPPYADRYPTAHATVSSPVSKGYASMYGWVQIVAETGPGVREPLALSDPAIWTMDPIPITEDLNTPFAWSGSEPTLFDAPFRSKRVGSMDWTRRSFLVYLTDALVTREVRPILGFQWGFFVEDDVPYVKQLSELSLGTWNEHVGLFSEKYSGWTFKYVEQ